MRQCCLKSRVLNRHVPRGYEDRDAQARRPCQQQRGGGGRSRAQLVIHAALLCNEVHPSPADMIVRMTKSLRQKIFRHLGEAGCTCSDSVARCSTTRVVIRPCVPSIVLTRSTMRHVHPLADPLGASPSAHSPPGLSDHHVPTSVRFDGEHWPLSGYPIAMAASRPT